MTGELNFSNPWEILHGGHPKKQPQDTRGTIASTPMMGETTPVDNTMGTTTMPQESSVSSLPPTIETATITYTALQSPSMTYTPRAGETFIRVTAVATNLTVTFAQPASVTTTLSVANITYGTVMATFVESSQFNSTLTGVATSLIWQVPISSSTATSPSTTTTSTTSTSPSANDELPLSSTRTHSSTRTSSPTAAYAKSHSISNSAVAGLGTGLAIAGLLLGIVISFLVFRYFKKRDNPPLYMSQSEKGEIIPLTVRNADTTALEQFLLDPTPESEISKELQALDQVIQQHCETHYHFVPVQVSENELASNLQSIGIENGSLSRSTNVAGLLMNPATRLVAIRHVIAKALFDGTALRGSSGISLLPPGVSDITSRIPATEATMGNHRATEAALSQWRQLSAFLLHPNRSDRTPLVPSDDTLEVQEHKLTVALNHCLELFIKGGEDGMYTQETHLEQVIRECATLGYLLFSQPSEYRLRFHNDEGLSGLVVCPGLYKIVNENGASYEQMITAPVVEPIQH